MPELPEVETIISDLRPRLVGRRFTAVSLVWPRMVLEPSAEEFSRRLPGRMIRSVARRGKYLIFRLDSGESLVLHLRMSGSLLLRDEAGADERPRYLTAAFGLDNGIELLFCDRRKLGTASLLENERALARKLGPEPLAPGFTARVLKERLSRRKAPIKALLCDQKLVAGIGNMYADEALFFAGIHPMRAAGGLSDSEIGRLHRGIRRVLRNGIRNAGATFSDYRRPGGEQGNQQGSFFVAHRGGQACKVCSTPIERIPIRNRGSYYCPRCQGTATCSGSWASASP
jgi:formamidopyrimidine-DNA glycosylase